MSPHYELLQGGQGVPIKAWTRGVAFEDEARRQLYNVASLPFIHKWVVAMPDVHWGLGATIGSVIPTLEAVIPAAVGVDIGCGVMALETSLRADQLAEDLKPMRTAIETAVPHGRTLGKKKRRDEGAWGHPPARVQGAWRELADDFERITGKHRAIRQSNHRTHLGTLGTGNHFIEVCLDEADQVWLMLHSGSRGVGNKIGRYFIDLAKKDMGRRLKQLPDRDLAYFSEGDELFDDYLEAAEWAQRFAAVNRELMMESVVEAIASLAGTPPFNTSPDPVNCHHNYVAREHHYGKQVLLTRKGAVRARAGEMGIIPGSMGARSYIVRGKGNPESFESCSHGAGRLMSRNQARRAFSVADHEQATAEVECRKDSAVLDETPGAYKPIDAVMRAQEDLVEIVHTLRQLVCVKG